MLWPTVSPQLSLILCNSTNFSSTGKTPKVPRSCETCTETRSSNIPIPLEGPSVGVSAFGFLKTFQENYGGIQIRNTVQYVLITLQRQQAPRTCGGRERKRPRKMDHHNKLALLWVLFERYPLLPLALITVQDSHPWEVSCLYRIYVI